MNDNDGSRFVLHFGIDDEGIDRARALFDLDPFLMTRRFVERALAQSCARAGVAKTVNRITGIPMLKAFLNILNVDLQNESRRMIKRGARCPSTVCLSQFSALTFIYYRIGER